MQHAQKNGIVLPERNLLKPMRNLSSKRHARGRSAAVSRDSEVAEEATGVRGRIYRDFRGVEVDVVDSAAGEVSPA